MDKHKILTYGDKYGAVMTGAKEPSNHPVSEQELFLQTLRELSRFKWKRNTSLRFSKIISGYQ